MSEKDGVLKTGEKTRRTVVKKRKKPYAFEQADVAAFLNQMKRVGRSETTVSKYGYDLNRLYEYLGEDKTVYPETLSRWKVSMIEDGYAPRTINSSIVAANRFLEFVGCHDWQLFDWMELGEDDSLELTRGEYQLLLNEAKRQENVQLYLIVKTLACTDLVPSDLILLTREAVNEGTVSGRMRGAQREVPLPKRMREELLDYAVWCGIRSGPIFLRKDGRPYDRFMVGRLINALGNDIDLEFGKANPRNLRKLYLNTLAEFRRKADAWVTESYGKLLEEEEAEIGWRNRSV